MSAPQLHKLKMLSLVSVASDSTVITYDSIMQLLDLVSVRVVEDMFMDCMYQNLILGKMDQRRGCFLVTFAASRDSSFDRTSMVQQLQNWCNAADNAVASLGVQINHHNKVKVFFSQFCNL